MSLFHLRRLGIGQAYGTIALLSIILGGCAEKEPWQTDTKPIQGTITINGEPAQGAVVTLYPTGDAVDIRQSKPWGVADENGVYQLRTYGKNDGAPQGEYKATFVWQVNPSEMGSPDMLSGAFADPAESAWTFVIAEDSSELPPIEADQAKVNKAPRRRSSRPTPFDDQ
ncbi:hypothetical protein M4951_04015 [Blastopirellula sp. J2-11]|uniref:hypothetical protein n=1 Tax=Blastopirellula sp. J2-11 TaxID=2943192 RepID=UPI0021C60181|nr:hypothetical protein [Blastopirellula sp. J2-11]UUO07481.1 hypothetical protein M4951_04015 [Blastopirellula sp. J2-11]